MYGTYPGYQMPQMPQRHEIIKVNGESGVNAFQMLPNSEVLLLDTTAPLVWYVQTDGNGYRTATPYTITEYVKEPPVDMGYITKVLGDINERLQKLEGGNHAESDS